MNKIQVAKLAVLLGVVLAGQVQAAFTLGGTRFVYEEGRKNLSVEVSNNAEQMYGGQVWVNNTTQSQDEVYFTPAPAFFKVEGKQKQIIRLLNINGALPKDRESLFWLNVQEIPPASQTGQNVLAIALNTQVKLFYRPQTLLKGREKAEQGLQVQGTHLKNPTPYYFAVTGVTVNGHKLALNAEQSRVLSQLAPFAEVEVGQALSGKVTVEAIDDYGARREYTLK